jgi:hypothetical protein
VSTPFQDQKCRGYLLQIESTERQYSLQISDHVTIQTIYILIFRQSQQEVLAVFYIKVHYNNITNKTVYYLANEHR